MESELGSILTSEFRHRLATDPQLRTAFNWVLTDAESIAEDHLHEDDDLPDEELDQLLELEFDILTKLTNEVYRAGA